MDYIYARVSTDAQNETSFEVQEESVRKQLELVSNAPITIIKEVGSGKDTEGRPKFLDMLAKLQKGDIVAIYDNSRLSRNIEISLFLLREINNKGARLLCDGKFISPDNPQDFMIFNIQSSFSTYQRQIQNQKSIEGLKKKYANGDAVFVSNLFGYETHKKGKVVTATIVEEEAKIIRHCYEEYAKGCSTTKLYNELWGTALQRPFIFNSNEIREILHRPLYMGYYFLEKGNSRQATNYSKEELIPMLVKSNIYPPIVDEDLWWQVHNSWRTFRRAGSVPFERRFAPHECSGVYHCCGCKGGMSHKHRFKNGTNYDGYEFNTHTPDCKYKYRTAYDDVWVEDVTRACFYITFLHGDEVGNFFEEQKAKLYENTAELQRALDAIDAEMKEVDTKIGRVVDAITEGILDNAVAKTKMTELREKKNSYQSQREKIANDIAMQLADVDDFLEGSASEVLENFDSGRRKYYLKYVKSGLNYNTHLTLEFMNGKFFTISRPTKHRGKIDDATIEVSYRGQFQYSFTFVAKDHALILNKEPSGDMWADAEYNYIKDIESKVNTLLQDGR